MSDASSDRPLVSVIVVTLNAGNRLRQCLQSLTVQDYPSLEIIVVDNGPGSAAAAMLKSEFPAVRCLEMRHNTGFAAGNNAGIREARGSCIALLNDDAIADRRWISALVHTALQNPEAGAVASIVMDGNNPERLDSCGVGIALDGMSRQACRGRRLSSSPIPPAETLAFSGCACLLRARALTESGLFDERFFAYCEDTDLSLRLWRAGWAIRLAPEAQVSHHYSQTGGAFSIKKIFWVERNHFWVAFKNFPFSLILLLPFFTAWRFLVEAQAVLRRHPALQGFTRRNGVLRILAVILAAHFAALAGLPAMLAWRRTFRPPRQQSMAEMRQLIFRFRLSFRDVIIGETADHAESRKEGAL